MPGHWQDVPGTASGPEGFQKFDVIFSYLADVSDIFYFVRLFRGREKFEAKRGGLFFIGKQRWGGGVPRRGGKLVHKEAGRVSRGGGGAKYFFSRPKCPPSLSALSSPDKTSSIVLRWTLHTKYCKP